MNKYRIYFGFIWKMNQARMYDLYYHFNIDNRYKLNYFTAIFHRGQL